MNLTKRETAIILAALRNVQTDMCPSWELTAAFPALFDRDDDTVFTEEIDELCLKVNCGDDELYTCTVGNLVDGFRLVGPFESYEAALKYGESLPPSADDWHVVPLTSTDEEDDNQKNR